MNIICCRRQCRSGLAVLEGSQKAGFNHVHVGPVFARSFEKVELSLDLGGIRVIAPFVVAALSILRAALRLDEARRINRARRGHEDFKGLRFRRRDHHYVSGAGMNARNRDQAIIGRRFGQE